MLWNVVIKKDIDIIASVFLLLVDLPAKLFTSSIGFSNFWSVISRFNLLPIKGISLMKTRILTIIVFSFLFLTVNNYAQLEIKPAIGINATGFSEDPENGQASANVGWQLGGTVAFGEKFYGEGGIFWTYKSTEFEENDTTFTFNTEISGIRIPAMIGYHLIGKGTGSLGLRAFGGASVFIVTKVDALELTKDDFNKASWGVFLGAGLDFSILFLDVKYEWSLTDVSSVTSFDVGKSKSLFVNAGVRLGL
jgi:hypothetical protein